MEINKLPRWAWIVGGVAALVSGGFLVLRKTGFAEMIAGRVWKQETKETVATVVEVDEDGNEIISIPTIKIAGPPVREYDAPSVAELFTIDDTDDEARG